MTTCNYCTNDNAVACHECGKPICSAHATTLYDHIDGHLLAEIIVCLECYWLLNKYDPMPVDQS
jgi:hypothetical protein